MSEKQELHAAVLGARDLEKELNLFQPDVFLAVLLFKHYPQGVTLNKQDLADFIEAVNVGDAFMVTLPEQDGGYTSKVVSAGVAEQYLQMVIGKGGSA